MTLREIYESNPGRLRDFIDESADSRGQKKYELKNGLAAQKTEQNEIIFDVGRKENIDAMRTHYSEKFPGTQGSNGLMDYRHMSILTGWSMAHGAELDATENKVGGDRFRYKIDFDQLGANRALLNFPEDGVVTGVFTKKNPYGIQSNDTIVNGPSGCVVEAKAAREMIDAQKERAEHDASQPERGQRKEESKQSYGSAFDASEEKGSGALRKDDSKSTQSQGSGPPKLYDQALSLLNGMPGTALNDEGRILAAESIASHARSMHYTVIERLDIRDNGLVIVGKNAGMMTATESQPLQVNGIGSPSQQQSSPQMTATQTPAHSAASTRM